RRGSGGRRIAREAGRLAPLAGLHGRSNQPPRGLPDLDRAAEEPRERSARARDRAALPRLRGPAERDGWQGVLVRAPRGAPYPRAWLDLRDRRYVRPGELPEPDHAGPRRLTASA